MKKLLLGFFIFMLVIPFVISKNTTCVYFFYGATCPHCAQEKPWLKELKGKYPELEVHEFEVYFNETNKKIWREVCEEYNTTPMGVPMTFIGNKVFIGFAEGNSEVYDGRYGAYVGYSGFMENTIKEYIRSGGVKCPKTLFSISTPVEDKKSNYVWFFIILGIIILIFVTFTKFVHIKIKR